MRNVIRSGFAISLLSLVIPVQAQTSAKSAAVALVEKAVAHVKKSGIEVACKDFANTQAGFIQGDLYVFVQDIHSKMICHAVNPKLNGKDLTELRDADGKQFSKAMADLAKTKRSGWVDYQWVNPTTKALEPKTTYIQRVDDTLLLGVGIYRK